MAVRILTTVTSHAISRRAYLAPDVLDFMDGVKGSEWIVEVDAWDELDGTLGTAPGSGGNPDLSVFETSYGQTYGFPVSHPFMGGSTTGFAAIRDALRFVANAPGEVVGPGRDGITRALRLIAEGRDVNHEGAGGIVDFDENGDVFGTIETCQVKNSEIQSTGRFELP